MGSQSTRRTSSDRSLATPDSKVLTSETFEFKPTLDGFEKVSSRCCIFNRYFVLQAVKEFPFPESQLFKMLVTNFSMCKVLKRASKDSGHGDHAENSGLRGGSDGGRVHQWGI